MESIAKLMAKGTDIESDKELGHAFNVLYPSCHRNTSEERTQATFLLRWNNGFVHIETTVTICYRTYDKNTEEKQRGSEVD